MHKYARDIRGGAAVPPALASDGSLLNANQLPASSNVLALRNARLLPNLSGTLSPADYADSVRRSETFNQPPASRGIQVESSLAVEEDMEVTTPNVPAFQAPSSAVGRGIGSLGCIRNDVDYLFSAGTFQEHWTELRKQLKTNVAVATVALLIASTPTDWQNITAFLEGNVTVPFTVLYTRPLIVFHT